jgi:D-cysteine desulfhydrase
MRTATADLSLVRRFPSLARLPRHALTELPTPVQPLQRLARRRGLGALWVKRDDLSGQRYGGNKPRKLEWLLGAARARGRRGVITFGGIGTHHGLATAICARDAGLDTVLVLLPQPVTDHVLHCLRLDQAAGAELHLAESVAGVAATALRLSAAAALRGRPLGIVPAGGTSATGIIGYVNAACELADQVRAGATPEPDAIFVALGSGGTVAGLALGCRLAGLRSRVVAVLVTDILPPSRARLLGLARGALRRLRQAAPEVPAVELRPDDIVIVRDYLGAALAPPPKPASRHSACSRSRKACAWKPPTPPSAWPPCSTSPRARPIGSRPCCSGTRTTRSTSTRPSARCRIGAPCQRHFIASSPRLRRRRKHAPAPASIGRSPPPFPAPPTAGATRRTPKLSTPQRLV